jgi:nucleoside-diphosphate-sugar epimerase
LRIFVAGASGVLGVRLVPLLVEAGHTVAGMTRSPERADGLRELGAEAVVCDVYDAEALEEAVVAFRPDAVIDQLTDLPDDAAFVPRQVAANGRIRREATRNLLSAARTARTARFLAQSVACPLDGDAGAAVEERERSVLAAGASSCVTGLRAWHVLRSRASSAASHPRRRGGTSHGCGSPRAQRVLTIVES